MARRTTRRPGSALSAPLALLALLALAASSSGCAWVTDTFGGIGGGSRGATAKKKHLPPSKIESTELKQAAAKAIKDARWKEKVLGISFSAEDWSVKRHKRSGLITHRSIPIWAALHMPGKSHCRLFSLGMKQEYDGQKFQKRLILAGVGSSFEVSCDTIVTAEQRLAQK